MISVSSSWQGALFLFAEEKENDMMKPGMKSAASIQHAAHDLRKF